MASSSARPTRDVHVRTLKSKNDSPVEPEAFPGAENGACAFLIKGGRSL